MTCKTDIFKSGFVALLGRPNVGKSTLLNAILQQKIAIVSPKPQTTRTLIRGIYTTDQGQIIFVDTPGIHRPKHRLGEHMVFKAKRSMGDADVALIIYDASQGWGEVEEELQRSRGEAPYLVVANKIDLLTERLLPPDGVDSKLFFPVSALTGGGLAELVTAIFARLPVGPQYYPTDSVTDQPERVIAAELIRESILELTREEIPHSVAVEVEEFKYRPAKNLTAIRAVIYVERLSQRKIILGHKGTMIKNIGISARGKIEHFVGTQVYLDLWVKVKEKWRDTEGTLQNLGLGRET